MVWEWLSDALGAVLKKFGILVTFRSERTGYMQPALSDTITLERMKFSDLSTIGEIRVDGDLLCYSLELSCRKANADGKMAIPMGKFQISYAEKIVTPKEKIFGFPLLHLENVPGRTAIEIHPANWPKQLEGCIAPGMRWETDAVYDSHKAFAILVSVIRERLQKGPVFIAVVGGGSSE